MGADNNADYMDGVSEFFASPLQVFALYFCALLIGMAKTGIQGVVMMSVPLMAVAFGAKESTGVILPMLCMADVIAVVYYKRDVDLKCVLRLLPSAVAGLFVAVAVDSFIPARQFKHLMAFCIFIGLATMVLPEIRKFWRKRKARFGGYGRVNGEAAGGGSVAEGGSNAAAAQVGRNAGEVVREAEKEARPAFMDKWWYSVFFGVMGGFTTMIGNAAGGVMSVYLLSMRFDKLAFVGTNAWFFLIINYSKLPLQIFAWDNISVKTMLIDLTALPFIFLGAFIGIWLVKRISERWYRLLIMAMTFVSTIVMMF